ncbi:Uncharacterised protein [uncultured archaeon]|nr:Uncharacterised protein [uncultured archaeon]
MKTLLENITFVKGIEYLIVVAFGFGFIALWLLIHAMEKDGMKRIVSLVIPLSLIFGGAAIVVNTHATPDSAPNITAITATSEKNFDTGATVPVSNLDKWFRVNNSEYLSITYGPDTKFHQVMSEKVSCQTCHHNSGNEIRACRDCHNAPSNPHNSTIPGLKAAYHQRCMSCHREEFSGPYCCSRCHTGEAKVSAIVQAPTRPHTLTWETCSKCHKNGIPGGQVSKIVYHDSCLKCHTQGIGGAAKIPADHAGRAGNTCSGCHKPAGG